MNEVSSKPLFHSKTCIKCGHSLNSTYYTRTKSLFYPDKHLPICNDCLEEMIIEHTPEGAGVPDWDFIDKLCQYADVPFVPEQFMKLYNINGSATFPIYANLFFASEYDGIGWKDYYDAYLELKAQGGLNEIIPLVNEAEKKKLQEKWGMNYDLEALHYLENLYDGLLMTQNISGALQGDQAIKICKISYEIDCRIREGADFDKLLSSYDKLVKTGEFTPKNVKNASDFESTGELFRWLEKRGWQNSFYDGVTSDVVDETIKNIQSWNQRLYTNESGLGDEINQRIESLKMAAELENYYDLEQDTDSYDEYDNDGFEELFKDETFESELDG